MYLQTPFCCRFDLKRDMPKLLEKYEMYGMTMKRLKEFRHNMMRGHMQKQLDAGCSLSGSDTAQVRLQNQKEREKAAKRAKAKRKKTLEDKVEKEKKRQKTQAQ